MTAAFTGLCGFLLGCVAGYALTIWGVACMEARKK